jgi:hypothetical protein
MKYDLVRPKYGRLAARNRNKLDLVRPELRRLPRSKSYFEIAMQHEFIGQETELRELRALQTFLSASLVILEGAAV